MSLLLSVTACTDDYTDWSAPQHNDQPATVQFGNGSITEVPVINLADVTDANVKVASITAPTSSDADYSQATYQIQLGAKTMDITADGEIATADLQQYILDNYGKAPEERDIDAVVTQWISNGTTSIKVNTSETFKVKAICKAADIEQAYYLASDATGWDLNAVKANAFVHTATNVWDDPTFKLTVDFTEDNQTFMIVPASSLEKSNVLDGAFGCQVEGDDSGAGTLTNEGAQKITVANAGKYVIAINMESKTYTISEAPKTLFMTGSGFNSWNLWHELTPYNGTSDTFWTIIYCAANDEFKFSPDAGWTGSDFGANADVTLNDLANAGVERDGTNIKVTKAGWYLLRVVNGDTRSVEFDKPEIYLVGETSSTGWNSCDPTADKLFTIPTAADGKFVSPELSNNGKFRAYVKFSDTTPDNNNWWKAEFSLTADGGFQFRGRNGDGADEYPCLEVEAGKKVYLDFANGKTEVK